MTTVKLGLVENDKPVRLTVGPPTAVHRVSSLMLKSLADRADNQRPSRPS